MNRKRAAVYMAIAAMLWSTGGILIKWIDWNPLAIAGSRSLIATGVMLLYLRKLPPRPTLNTCLGAVCYAMTLMCFVSANKMTTAANAILLQFTAPIWVALLSGWLLKEKVRRVDWLTIGIVFGGMALFFMEGMQGGAFWGNVIAVASGIFFAGCILFMKRSPGNAAVDITIFGNILTFVICLPFMRGGLPDPTGLLALLALGLFQIGLAYVLYTQAVPHLSAIECILIPVIEPLLNPVWVLLGTGEKPSLYALAGGVVVMGAVIGRTLFLHQLTRQEKASEA